MSVSIDSINERIRKSINEDSEKTGKIVFDSLLVDIDRNRLPEDIFRDYFLPRFIGLIPQNQAGNYVAEWIAIAGTPMREVIIFDRVTNQDLFIVPSIINSASLYSHKEEGDIGDILTRAAMVSQNNPTAATGFIMSSLDSRLELLTKDHNNTPHVQRWLEVFERYGYVQSNVTTSTEESVPQQDVSDFFY